MSATGMDGLVTLYSAFIKAENRVGGGEGLVGIYGSMTQQGTCNIMAAMVEHAGLAKDSVLVDIGSGLCRPLLHASVEHGVQRTFGVELDAVKCQKALPFVRHAAAMMEAEGHTIPESALPTVICASVEEMGSLDPATHAYAAWEGFPVDAKEAIGRLFRCTHSLRAITIVQRSLRNEDPVEVMAELGFGAVECRAAALPVYMAGSGRKLNAYLFVKAGDAADAATAAPTGPSLITATPFTSEQVISQLGRMASAAAGSPTSDRTASVTTSAHASGHGLRPRKEILATSSSRHSSSELPRQLKGLAVESPPKRQHVSVRTNSPPTARSKKPVARTLDTGRTDASVEPDQTAKAQSKAKPEVASQESTAPVEAGGPVKAGTEHDSTAQRRSGRVRKSAA